MIVIFNDMLHDFLEDVVDDVIVKSEEIYQHYGCLRKVFLRCKQYNQKNESLEVCFWCLIQKLLRFTILLKESITTISNPELPKIWSLALPESS